MRFVLATVLALVSAVTFAAQPQGDRCPIATTGHYANSQYGFAFSVPASLSGQWQSPCTLDKKHVCVCLGNHGLAFDLPGGGTLGVFADYAAELDEPTLDAVLAEAEKRIRDAREDIQSASKTTFKGQSGYIIKATGRGRDGHGGDVYRRVEYLFLTKDGRVDIYLHAPLSTWQRDLAFLIQLLDSWKWAIY